MIVPWPPNSFQNFWSSVREERKPQLHVLVFRVSLHFGIVSEEHKPLAVGGRMREPVVGVIPGDRFPDRLPGFIRQDLHPPGAG